MISGVIFDWNGTLYRKNGRILPYSRAVLNRLEQKDYSLGLVTLASEVSQSRQNEIESSGLKKYLKSVVITDVKDEEAYLKCMEELKTKPKETAIVGDRIRREIVIGNSLECTTIWISEGSYAHEIPRDFTETPTFRIKDLTGLLTLLR